MSDLIYLDHAATTPLDPEVLEVMMPYFGKNFENPGGMYSGAFEAQDTIKKSREIVAEILGCTPQEVIFTSGGSESDNLALRGVMNYEAFDSAHMITCDIEHHAILHTAEDLEKLGHKLTTLPVNTDGRISLNDLQEAITDETRLISIMLANNEIGTIQPIKEISKIIQESGKNIYLHTDAVQGVNYIDLNVDKWGVDMMSLSGHKFGGPRDTGALYVKSGTKLRSQITGGGQEFGRRAGTENVAGIVGFAKALQLASHARKSETIRISELRDHAISRLLDEIPNTILNGSHEHRIANNVNVSFWGVEGESILLHLDKASICAATGSACTSNELDASHVIMAIGQDHNWSHGSIRLSLGKSTTKENLDHAIDTLKGTVVELRKFTPVNSKPSN